MAISSFTQDMDIISKLSDNPTGDDASMTAADFKGEFDKAGKYIKSYINNVLLPGITSTLQNKISSLGLLKCTSAGTIEAAVAGTDYQTPLTAGEDYQTPLTPDVDYQTPLTPGTDYETPLNADQKRKITVSSEDPTGGNDGDIWLKYEVTPEPEPEA